MAFLIHGYKDDQDGEPDEYILLSDASTKEDLGEDELIEGYDNQVYELDAMAMQGDWPARLPTDRILRPARF